MAGGAGLGGLSGAQSESSFAPGAMVRTRGREWVVLPESDERLLVLRPLGGTDDEIAGVLPALEPVEPAAFSLPDPTDPRQIGDFRSSRLLRDAVRLGFRSSAGPFRSFGALGVEPRPYQLVPLLMGLKLDPVRLLVADDVGIGKTIEAALVAKELLERGEVERLAVLCPPPLAEQWQSELREKFHIEAELVLASTASRLERDLGYTRSLFDLYPYVVVSTDFIKSDRRRDEFLRTCPELVIVDEAHTCAWGGMGRGARHQRFELISGLAANPKRHLILVTATPHSGNEEAFRSLLGFLDPAFLELPESLSGEHNRRLREHLARHFVQRRRGDIKRYLATETPFPKREEREVSYKLSPDYRAFLNRVLSFIQETVRDESGTERHRRVRWWSALALLRSVASSPAAAAATLRTRAAPADAETVEETDEIGRRTVLDLMDADSAEGVDTVPGSDAGEESGEEGSAAGSGDARDRRRLMALAREADALAGQKDEKLKRVAALVSELVAEGFSPLVFCRFIPTAEYVAEELRHRLGNKVEVAAVTGLLPPAEREERIAALSLHEKRVLVSTDCLSEGINLQEHWNAVVHYDLSWNPTRHEQREGRVDRYGQARPTIRVLTYYGIDNQIDGIVLDVLIRKHNTIRGSLGVSVPVPFKSEQVLEAIFEGLLLRDTAGSGSGDQMKLFDELVHEHDLQEKKEELHREWDAETEREKRSRTMFAQEAIKAEEVAEELAAVREAIGSGDEVARFVAEAVVMNRGTAEQRHGCTQLDFKNLPRALKDLAGIDERHPTLAARFERPVAEGEVYLSRTHPLVEGLADYVLSTALDPEMDGVARRLGVVRTGLVQKRTTLLLLRFRHQLRDSAFPEKSALLAEEAGLLAFAGAPDEAEWLSPEEAEGLLEATPEGNVLPDAAREQLSRVVQGFDHVLPHLDEEARRRAKVLAQAHRRVRQAARGKSRVTVEPHLPPDVIGLYLFLPHPKPAVSGGLS